MIKNIITGIGIEIDGTDKDEAYFEGQRDAERQQERRRRRT